MEQLQVKLKPTDMNIKIVTVIIITVILAISVPVTLRLAQTQQVIEPKASAGECRNNPETPPSGYEWRAACGGSECTSNEQCPRGANNQIGWCYGFDSGSRCLQLVSIVPAPQPPAPQPQPPAPQNPPPPTGGTPPPPASVSLQGQIWNIQPNPVIKSGGSWPQIRIDLGANEANWRLIFRDAVGECTTSCSLQGWSTVTQGKDDKSGITFTPDSGVAAGVHAFALFDGNARLVDVVNITFQDPGGGGTPPPTGGTPPPPTTTTPPPPATGNTDNASECRTPQANLLEISTRKPAAYAIENTDYIARLIMKNTGKSPWKAGEYKLAPSDNTKILWGAQPVSLDEDLAVGSEKVFDVRVKAPATTNREHRTVGYYFRMEQNGVAFGAACEPQVIDITPTPIVVEPTTTSCYALSEDNNEVKNVEGCDDDSDIVHPYTDNPITYTLKDTTAGSKNIYVMFFDNKGNKSNSGIPYVQKVVLAPDPVITSVVCNQTGSVDILGRNFGEQGVNGKAKVKVGGQDATIANWTGRIVDGTSRVTVNPAQKLDGQVAVQLTTDEGKIVTSSCRVDTTTVEFTAVSQCKLTPISMDNVDVQIFPDLPTQSAAQPLVRQKIRIDREGKPQSFAPKLEVGKKYVIVIKGAETVARRAYFTATAGNTVIPNKFVLPVGNIYPREAPDTAINNLDASELKTQWSPLKDVNKPGDINGDNRVNTLDFSCLLENLTKEDERFVPSPISSSGATGVGATGGGGTSQLILTALSLNVNDRTPEVGDNVTFSGLLEAGGSPVSGKVIRLVNTQTNQTIQFSTPTNSQGAYQVVVNIEDDDSFNVKAVFAGDSTHAGFETGSVNVNPN